ncbi:MAG: hypothetical protein MUC49_09540 [Raineya sp.]|jgi:hypothetical protein|nr:hypothetical protein [Raineya sp.]
MKNLILIILVLLITPMVSLAQKKSVSVKGYYRKNGTYVRPHTRSYSGSSSSSSTSKSHSSKSYSTGSSYSNQKATDEKPEKTDSTYTPTNTTKSSGIAIDKPQTTTKLDTKPAEKKNITPAIVHRIDAKSNVNVSLNKKSIIIEIVFDGDKKCVQKNQKFKIWLEQGGNFTVSNTAETNCNGKLSCTIEDKTLLEKMASYKIQTIQTGTDKGFINVGINNVDEVQIKISNLYQQIK